MLERLKELREWLALGVALIAVGISLLSYWSAREAELLASKLVPYEVFADDQWNLTLRDASGDPAPIEKIWITAYFDDSGNLPDTIASPERPLPVPAPKIGSGSREYVLTQMERTVCSWLQDLSCQAKPLTALKVRYQTRGRTTTQYVQPVSLTTG